jgi:hypothetical protein
VAPAPLHFFKDHSYKIYNNIFYTVYTGKFDRPLFAGISSVSEVSAVSLKTAMNVGPFSYNTIVSSNTDAYILSKNVIFLFEFYHGVELGET